MGVKIYWYVVAIVLVSGLILPQQGQYKKVYIILMGILHSLVCGFRYMYIFGDLRVYASTYYRYYNYPEIEWFSEMVYNGGRNAGWEWVLKSISLLTHGDFQFLLILLAVFAEIAIAIFVYKYSPRPWLSYLVWNCLGFFITYDFCLIKQGLAMTLLIFAMICILEKKPIAFLVITLLAAFIHAPALCFLPAYWLMNRRVSLKMLVIYVLTVGLIFTFRNHIVSILQDVYYAGNGEVEFNVVSGSIGGRFFVIMAIAIAGIMFKGFREKDFAGLFSIMIFAAILQMFSVYDNVFTRLVDYYFQFSILYIPLIFYPADYDVELDERGISPFFRFNAHSRNIIVAVLVVILLWWYNRTVLGVSIAYEVDNYLNYRSMWYTPD